MACQVSWNMNGCADEPQPNSTDAGRPATWGTMRAPARGGLVGQLDEPAPELGAQVVLEAAERDGASGLAGDGGHPRELGLGVEHVARHLEHAGTRLAQGRADADQLVGAGGGAGGELAVLGAVQQRAGGGEAHGVGLDRFRTTLAMASISSGVASAFWPPRSPMT